MNIQNEMHLKFLSKSSNESFARSAVAAFTLELDPTIAELADIKTAVSEAVTNAIVHGYRRESGMIYIDVRLTTERDVIIKIRDKGVGIEDVTQAMQPLYLSENNRYRVGREPET